MTVPEPRPRYMEANVKALAAVTHSSSPRDDNAHRDKLLLTAEEVAQALGIGRSKVYELMASGQLRSVAIGRLRRVPAARLAEFVANLDVEA